MGEPPKPPVSPSANFSNTAFPNTDSAHTLRLHVPSRALRVLIADDHEAVRIGLCAILESAGIEVCAQATNGEEAVEKSIQLRPDLIILDISMPVSEEWKQRGRSEFFFQRCLFCSLRRTTVPNF